MLKIYQDTFDMLGYDLDAEITNYTVAWKNHAKTINVAAPVARDSLVERIVKQHGGQYQIIESPESDLQAGNPQSLTNEIIRLRTQIQNITNFCNQLLTVLKKADIKQLTELNVIQLIGTNNV